MKVRETFSTYPVSDEHQLEICGINFNNSQCHSNTGSQDRQLSSRWDYYIVKKYAVPQSHVVVYLL